MEATAAHDQSIAKLSFTKVYPMYVDKVVKKGRTVDELHQVIEWLTGYDAAALDGIIAEDLTFEEFFEHATIHPNASLITGVICGYRIEDLKTPTTQYTRYLDKLVDELAKGRKMVKILR